MLHRIFPFLSWFKGYRTASLRADVVAGVTVALVLIPQSMAYAQLAGLPPYYGLYAAFLPPMVAALFGSSRQLATGPVAVVSLMTAATLEPLATAGGEGYIAYAILLSLAVGTFQLTLGLLRLGVVVNFLSHPVVNGFTNAAAIIIATSQLSKIFGVHVDKAEHHYETIARVVVAAWHYTHWPTLGLAVLAFAVMVGLRKLQPRIPNVLVAVVLTTVISWAVGFRHETTAPVASIEATGIQAALTEFNDHLRQIEALSEERTTANEGWAVIEHEFGKHSVEAIRAEAGVEVLALQLEAEREAAHLVRDELRGELFEAVEGEDGALRFYPDGMVPAGLTTDGRRWRLSIGRSTIDPAAVPMSGGGDVVGSIPKGLPPIALPELDFQRLLGLMGAAVIISLLGFMEAISIAKAMAVKTGQRLDPNQELVGQGLSNLVGALGQSYPVSGSFSRSAVNLQAGAVSGLSSVVTSLVVMVVLLFFTPLLYHLPQSVLAAVIMVAVLGLVNVTGFVHAFRAKREEGIISVTSFVATLAFAPHLDKGILIGVGLSIALFLYEYMRPRVTFLSRHNDGAYRDAKQWHLQRCQHVLAVRFYGKLFFANAAALEKRVLEAVEEMPELRHVILVGNGISDVDASGEEILDQLVGELRSREYTVSFSGLRDPVMAVLERTRLREKIGEQNFYPNVERAANALCCRVQEDLGEHACPLLQPLTQEEERDVAIVAHGGA